LKASDLSISSIDCAVALSSSISNTRIAGPLFAAFGFSQRRNGGKNSKNAFGTERFDTIPTWLTKSDSRLQASRSRRVPNRRKMLSESDFSATGGFMSCVKSCS
jgi:hypothetical protein